MLSQVFLSGKVACGSIIDQYHHSTVAFSEMQGQQSLMLCWCSFLGHGSHIFEAFWRRMVADSSIMGWFHRIAVGFSEMQIQQLLMLCWRLVFEPGNKHVNCHFSYNADQNIYFKVTWKCSPLIVECERLKIIDAPLTLIFGLGNDKWSSYTESSCATDYIHIIDIRYCISNYFHLHPEGFWHFNLWSISMHVMWVRDDVAPSRSCAFGWQLTACKSFH